VNNSIYYHLFDSVVNAYLISQCGQNPSSSPQIGLVVSSYANFFRPLSFPAVLELALRVNKLGTSSVEYEVGVFKEGVEDVASVGGYTHVFVKSDSRKPIAIQGKLRSGLESLLISGTSARL
jgi:acyl-CoA thioester hydrolase